MATVTKEQPLPFHGAQTAAVLFVIYGVAVGAVYFTAGPLVAAMLPALKWNYAVISGAFTVRALLGLLGPVVGLILARFGARRVIIFGGVATGILTALVGLTYTPVVFYLLFGAALSFADGLMGYLPVFTTVSQWWLRRRGIMTGIVAAAGGLGGFVFAPFLQILIQAMGWRLAMAALGGVILVLGVIPAWLWLRNRPEDIGEHPDGLPPTERAAELAVERRRGTAEVREWATGEALRTWQIWALMVIAGAEGWALGTYAIDQMPYLEAVHVNALAAATILGSTGLLAAAGGILVGPLTDRVGPYFTLILATLLESLGAFFLLDAHSMASVYAYAVLFGLGYGVLVPTVPVSIAAYFGRKNYPTIYGWGFIVYAGLSGVGPLVSGFLIDQAKGNFLPAFHLVLGFLLLSLVLAVVARPPGSVARTTVTRPAGTGA
jgi:MFS family permease